MLICRFSIQDHHDLKLYRLSSTIKNFVEIKKTDSLACIGNDQNAQCGGCFGFSNVLFWLQKANASTLDRRQMKIYLNFTNQTTFILFVFLSSSLWIWWWYQTKDAICWHRMLFQPILCPLSAAFTFLSYLSYLSSWFTYHFSIIHHPCLFFQSIWT